MKKIIASVFIACALLALASCGEEKPVIIDEATTTAEVTTDAPDVDVTPEVQRVTILTEPYEKGYESTGELDLEAFLDYLSEYFYETYTEETFWGTGYDKPMVVAVNDIIANHSPDSPNGVVTVLAEYHTADAEKYGRNGGTLCGSCNFFFDYDPATGKGFGPRPFAGGEYLHGVYKASGNDFSRYTATLDTDGTVQLVKDGAPTIKTPAVYRWYSYDFADDHQLYINGDNIILMLFEHGGKGSERAMHAYTSSDGGKVWTVTELDYTPTTTTLLYPVDTIVLNMRDDLKGSAILGTSRCEVFFYTTRDGGVTWQKQRNFKLLHYRYDALLEGGLVTDELGFITFTHRGKNDPNVYITSDGGKNWDLMNITSPDENISFIGAYAGRAFGETDPDSGEMIVKLPVYLEPTGEWFEGEKYGDYCTKDLGASWYWDIAK